MMKKNQRKRNSIGALGREMDAASSVHGAFPDGSGDAGVCPVGCGSFYHAYYASGFLFHGMDIAA